jgi:hypothetical protein
VKAIRQPADDQAFPQQGRHTIVLEGVEDLAAVAIDQASRGPVI